MSSGIDSTSALRLRIQGAVLVILIFFVGALAGGAIERVRSSRDKPMRPFRQFSDELPRPFARLDLSDEQRTAIMEIFENARPLADSVMRELMPHLSQINDSVQARIREILTPEQAAILEEEFSRRRGGRPGGFDGRWRRPFMPEPPPQ